MNNTLKKYVVFERQLIILVTLLTLLSSNGKADTADFVTATITDNILNIELTNATTFCAFQMDIKLPAGVSLAGAGAVMPVAGRLGQNGSGAELGDMKFIVDEKILPDGKLRISAYNLANAPIALAEGSLLQITLDQIPDTPTTLAVSDIEFVRGEDISSATLPNLSAENGSGTGYTISMTSLTQQQISSLPNGTIIDLSDTKELSGESTNTYNIIYKRPVSDNGIVWGSICMPTAITSTENMQLYTVSGISHDAVTITAKESLEAGEPGLYNLRNGGNLTIRASGQLKQPQTSAYLIGVMKRTNVTDENTFYLKGNQFWSINNNFNISAFKAYLKEGGSVTAKSSTLEISENGITAIDALIDDARIIVDGIYDMQGVARKSPRKGLNILRFSNGTASKIFIR